MPTISFKVSKKELDAIQEYANSCGETVSNIIRKTVVGEAIFNKVYGDSLEYDCNVEIPDEFSGDEESKFLLEKINRIRRILGLKEQDEI